MQSHPALRSAYLNTTALRPPIVPCDDTNGAVQQRLLVVRRKHGPLSFSMGLLYSLSLHFAPQLLTCILTPLNIHARQASLTSPFPKDNTTRHRNIPHVQSLVPPLLCSILHSRYVVRLLYNTRLLPCSGYPFGDLANTLSSNT